MTKTFCACHSATNGSACHSMSFIVIHCHFLFALLTTLYSLLSKQKRPLHTRVMVFLFARTRHFALRYSRSSWLAYVATLVHLLKLLAKIQQKTENEKRKAKNFLFFSIFAWSEKTEATPNRAQRVLADSAEVRRSKSLRKQD